jgi:hypothetical protein
LGDISPNRIADDNRRRPPSAQGSCRMLNNVSEADLRESAAQERHPITLPTETTHPRRKMSSAI